MTADVQLVVFHLVLTLVVTPLTLLTWAMYVQLETPKESVHRPDIPGYHEGWSR